MEFSQYLKNDAPELLRLLTELREGLDDIRSKLQPLVKQVNDGQHSTKQGISYLEVKHLLLLSYCQSLIFYLLLKAEGCSVRDHPIIARLVEMRLYLEKIRPIDKKLDYQIEKLLKAPASLPATDQGQKDEDALKYRPNPDLLVSKLDQDTQEGGGLYRPPMIAPAVMDGEEKPRDKLSKARADKEVRRRASRSAFIKDLANELEGRPQEMQELLGIESKEMLKEKSRLEARAQQEEELFARVPLSRVERHKLKHLRQSRNGLMGMVDDLDDDVGDLVGMEDGRRNKSGADNRMLPRRSSRDGDVGKSSKRRKGN